MAGMRVKCNMRYHMLMLSMNAWLAGEKVLFSAEFQ